MLFVIQFEQEQQQQELTDLNLKSEMQRISLEQQLQLEKLNHQHTIEK